MSARHVVGIDLGTTHSALAFAEHGQEKPAIDILPVLQLVARAALEERVLLPSFYYAAHESEGAQSLPWDQERTFVIGEYARARGIDAPNRLVSSAKSWLSHAGVDRRSALLPLGAPEDVEKISPVEASWRYLEHLSEAWAHKFGAENSLGAQEIVLTVPASFDAAARDLTVEAAGLAGFEDLTLLEEPQAALYAWIDEAGDDWRKYIHPGDIILVVDVGGGTTDFSAIAATEENGALALHRVAVGDHILLGGDNMDLALAYVARKKLLDEGKELDRWQMIALTHAARIAKERILLDASIDKLPVVVPSRGAKLLGASLRTELSREDVQKILVDGFFPSVNASARPQARPRAALTQIGLPYAHDAAVTRHLAAFLGRHAKATERIEGFSGKSSSTASILHPTVLLFNGGVMKGKALSDRVVSTLNAWLEAEGAKPVRVLPAADLDLAVAKGAATYGLVRKGRGLRIRGGTARAYYVGIESAMPAVPGMEPPITALCVAPFGMEEGTKAALPPHELGVVVGEPVRFRFFGSSVRRDDRAGTELESWKEGEIDELSPIEVTLPADGRMEGDVVPVRLEASVTEVGTLLVEAVPLEPQKPGERWKVELGVRSHAGEVTVEGEG
ncbi:MAG: Hsp70 family protein [Polyangiaceae bacterium]|nr:Hsp70 family protein [Polyangiaceae bacterium]